MYKVLIADDKEYEREYLHKFITSKYPHDLRVVCTAQDGEEALRQLYELKPDLLLLDIIMPKLDGLEIAQQAKKAFPQVVIVMISAYAEFDYVKEALKIGVRDYLLKPYVDEELQETIDHILLQLDRVHRKESEPRDLEPTALTLPLLEEKTAVLKSIFDKKGNVAAEYFLSTFGSTTGYYKCIVFYSPQKFFYDEENIHFIKNIFTRNDLKVMVGVDLFKLVLILWGSQYADFNEIDHSIKRTRTYIIDTKEIQKDLFFCGVSAFYEEFDELPRAYTEAVDLIKNNTLEKISKMLQRGEEYCQAAHDLEKQISLEIINKRKETATARFKELYALLQDSNGMAGFDQVVKDRLLQAINYVLNNVESFVKRENEPAEEKPFASYLALCHEEGNSFDELLLHWEALLEELTARIGGISVYNNVLLVKKAKEYIAEHYQEKISLQIIAEKLGISYGYLSKCFKDVEGRALTDYLNQFRIERAKELMETKNLNISEVSYAVGFGDPNYFSKCFKKYTGLTPKEYWQMILVDSLD